MIATKMPERRTPHTIDEHVALLTSERVVKRVAERTTGDLKRTAATLNTYAAECRYGLGMITKRLPSGGRILEVGAGSGMLSAYLRLLGHDITALEPSAAEFGFFAEIQAAVSDALETDVPFLRIRAEELSAARHGTFQFIFSVNVLEHIPDLTGAMRGMASVLAPGGRMWHTCPNYLVPYEPHFGLPLIPLFPRTTSLLLPRRIAGSDVWRSLNFVTYFGLKHLALANDLNPTFQAGTMAEAFRRLDSDSDYGARQSGFVSRIYRVLKTIGGISAIEAFPAAVSTPLMVAMEKKHSA
jgi:2-polyprenyl-3-methyl-5-hydroxy-6-metoxy-1,4-benzoquinol methylase